MLRRFQPSIGSQIRYIILLVFISVWQFAPASRPIRVWISDPISVVSRLVGWLADGTIWTHLLATIQAMVGGYFLGALSGILIGILLGLSTFWARVWTPFLVAVNSLPKIALAPLLIITLGVGIEFKIALVTITVFFLVFNNTFDGILDVDTDSINALRIMGSNKYEYTTKIIIPSALPWIFTGLRISVRYAFSNTLLAELIGSNKGIGFLVQYYSSLFESSGVYAAILIIVLFSISLNEILMWLEPKAPRTRM